MSYAWIYDDALAEVRSLARDRHPLETGGLLLGWTDEDTGDAVVAAIIGPGPEARHGPASFLPDGDWQRSELARRYADSGRVHGYLGDWHTHPLGTGRPSGPDRRTLASIARAPLARAPRPLLAILSGDPDGPVAVWRHRRRPLPLERLPVRAYGP